MPSENVTQSLEEGTIKTEIYSLTFPKLVLCLHTDPFCSQLISFISVLVVGGNLKISSQKRQFSLHEYILFSAFY